jgi:uncharacterized membrane protein
MIDRNLQGKPLTSRTKWMTIKVAYVLGCAVGVVAVLALTSGVVLAIGLTVMAFFVGGLFELFSLTYQAYREEWELANNGSELDSDGPSAS